MSRNIGRINGKGIAIAPNTIAIIRKSNWSRRGAGRPLVMFNRRLMNDPIKSPTNAPNDTTTTSGIDNNTIGISSGGKIR